MDFPKTTYHLKTKLGYACDWQGGEIVWTDRIENAAWWTKRGAIDLAFSLIRQSMFTEVRVIALCKDATIEKCVRVIKQRTSTVIR